MGIPILTGFSSADKVPGAYGEVIYGAGALSAGDIPLELLLVGMMISGGTATPDVDIVPIASATDAQLAFGSRSQLARMCYKALQVDGVTIKAIAVTAPSGVAATLTLTVAGTWTAGGTYNFRLGGESYSVAIAVTDTTSNVATNISAAINANATGFCTSAPSSAVVTATVAFVGATGNQYVAVGDSSQLPNGCTVTLGGNLTLTGGAVTFGATLGTGVESIDAVKATLFPTQYARIAVAQNDVGNIGKWKTQLNSQASPVEGRRQHLIAATNVAWATAETLASTTMNAQRMELLNQLNGETHPSEVAAFFGALRTQSEQNDPCSSYDDALLVGVAPNAFRADWPSHATLVTALNMGVTPIYSTVTEARICRAIVTHCLTGSTPDYRTLDVSDATVPDYVLLGLLLNWSTSFKINNPRVRDNPAPEEPPVTTGVATPDIWNRVVTAILRAFERGDNLAFPIITNVSDNLPASFYDPNARRIMSSVNVLPAANQHQVGVSVRQVSA